MKTEVTTPCSEPDLRDLFFSDLAVEQRQAKKHCEGCPMSTYLACREDGFEHEYGVFGGLTPADRRRMDPERHALMLKHSAERSLEVDEQILRDRDEKVEAELLSALLAQE